MRNLIINGKSYYFQCILKILVTNVEKCERDLFSVILIDAKFVQTNMLSLFYIFGRFLAINENIDPLISEKMSLNSIYQTNLDLLKVQTKSGPIGWTLWANCYHKIMVLKLSGFNLPNIIGIT